MKTKPPAGPGPAVPPSPRLRQYLYFTAGITGMVIMMVEILGAKMLAPYVGTSHFVWTAQIAVTLVALAAGYYAGGRLVDRAPELSRLYTAILVAAVYLCLAVFIVKPVAFWCLDFKLALGSLLASTILFFIPLSLLAMVGPFFVRVLTSSVNNVGGNVGRLTAIGTFGSFVGTILIGYVLIPFLPNSTTMLLSAGLLMLVAAGYFLLYSRKSSQLTPALLGIALGAVFGFFGVLQERQSLLPGTTTQLRANSNFGQIWVLDINRAAGNQRYYLNDFLCQNACALPACKSTTMFTYLLHGLARAYTTKIDDALCIGLGVGIVPRELLRNHANVDVVEINPAIVPVAKNFFDCPVEKLNLTIGDGRQFLHHCPKKFDVIILDAFLGDASPAHLMTQEAFTAMRGVLKSNGVLVINSFGKHGAGHDFLAASLNKTLQHVFHSVRIHYDGTSNMMFVASDQPELKFATPPDFTEVYPGCRDQVESTFATTPDTDPKSGIVLTDDYNPVEFYDANNREDLRRLLVESIIKP